MVVDILMFSNSTLFGHAMPVAMHHGQLWNLGILFSRDFACGMWRDFFSHLNEHLEGYFGLFIQKI